MYPRALERPNHLLSLEEERSARFQVQRAAQPDHIVQRVGEISRARLPRERTRLPRARSRLGPNEGAATLSDERRKRRPAGVTIIVGRFR